MMANMFRRAVFQAFTFLVWAFAAASVAYWSLKLLTPPVRGTVAPVASSRGWQVDSSLVSRVFGASKMGVPAVTTVPASSRFSLMGMVAGGAQSGIALISVDSKPAKPVRVGGKLEDGMVLQSVAPRRATVGVAMDAPASFVLELPGTRSGLQK